MPRRLNTKSAVLVAFLFSLTLLPAAPALGIDTSWNTNTYSGWKDSYNWTAGVPNAIGDIARLTYNITVPRPVTIENSAYTVGSLYFYDDDTGYTVTGVGLKLDVASGSALIQSDGGSTVTHTITAPVILYDATTMAVNAGTLQISGAISSGIAGIAVTKTGAGTLILGAANSWSNGTIINGGQVVPTLPEALGGTAVRDVMINSSGALRPGYATSIQSLLNSRVNTTSTGSILAPAATSENLDFAALGMNIYFGVYGGGAYTGTITPNASTYRLSTSANWTLPNQNTLTGARSVVVGGSGEAAAYLLNTNDYTGSTTIQKGWLAAWVLANGGTESSIGKSSNAAGNLVFNGGGLRYVGAGNIVIDRNYTTLGDSGFDVSGLGTLEVAGNMTAAQAANATMTLQGAGTGTLSGSIVDAPGAKTTKILKAGAGTWILRGTNSYTGGTQVDGGVLRFDSAGAIGGTGRNVTVNAGGAVALGFMPIQSTLNGRIASASTGTVALAANSSENLDFSAAGANFTASYLGAIGSVNYTGTLTPNGTIYRLGGGGGTLTLGNANALTGSGKSLMVGGGAGGTVVLAATNNYTGGTTINTGGTLSVSNAAQLGSGGLTFSGGTLRITGAQTFSSSAAVALTADAWVDMAGSGTLAGAITGTKALNMIGNGTLTLSGGATSTYSGNTNIYSGTVRLGADNSLGKGNLRAQGMLDLNGHNLTIKALNGNGLIDNTAGAGAYTLTVGTSSGGGGTFTGAIQNTTGTMNLAVVGGSTTLLKGMANTFSGSVAIKEGALVVASLGSSGVGSNGTGVIRLGDTTKSGSLTYFGGPITLNRTLDLAGTTGTGGFNSSGYGPVHLTGGVTASGSGVKTFYLEGDGPGDNIFSGDIVDSSGGATRLYKYGRGTWVLDGAKSYTGGTAIGGGVLAIYSDSSLGAAAGGITFSWGSDYLTILQFRAPITSSRPITFAANAGDRLAIDTDYSTTLSGLISGTGTFKKTGSGTLTLNGIISNTYTASRTEVYGGTLLLDFANMAAPTDLIPAASTCSLGGGTLRIQGNPSGITSQTLNGTRADYGDSKVVVDNNGGGGTTLNLGEISVYYATVDFTLPGGGGKITTTSANSSTYGIITGYATVGGSTWAYATGASSPYTIAGLPDSAYSTTLAANANIDIKIASPISVDADASVSTLRFNDSTGAANVAISSGKKLTLRMGGILVTGEVGGDPQITGGSIGPYSSGDVTIIQNSTAHDLTINSAIQGNTIFTHLIKSGPGKTVLTGAVTLGTTLVHAGTLVLTGTGTIKNTYDITLGTASASSPFATMTLDSPDASITSGGLVLGDHGAGVFAQSAGTVTVGGLRLGVTSGNGEYLHAHGTYNMSGGILNVLANTGGNNPWFSVGEAGEGAMNLSGTAQVNVSNAWMYVGLEATSAGTMTQGGNSVVNLTGSGALAIGWRGPGMYTQEGNSQVNVDGQVIIGAASISTYYLNGGTLTTSGLGSGGTSTGFYSTPFGGMFTAGSSLTFGGGTFRAGGSCSVTAPIVVGAGGGTIDTNGHDVRLSQLVSGPGALTKAASDGALVLVGSNSFTGGLRVNGGKVIASGPAPTGTGTVTLSPGAVLSLEDTQPGLLGEYYNDLWDTYNSATLANVNAHYAGKTPTVLVASTDRGKANFDFGIDGTGFPAPYTWDPYAKSGARDFEARWTGKFNAATTGLYTFTTSSDEGSMVFIDGQVAASLNTVGNPRANPTDPLRAASGGPILLEAGPHDIVLTFALGATYKNYYGYFVDVTLPGQAQQRLSNSLLQHSVGGDATVAALAGSGSVTLGSHTLTVDGGNSEDFAGIISGTGGLVKTGLGTQILSGANTYTGPTNINQGKLIIGAGGSLASNLVTVAGDATLGGNGTVLGDLVARGFVAPGTSPGILTVDDITFASGSTLQIELGGLARGTEYDVLAASGVVTMQGGSTLGVTLINGFVPQGGETFDIMDFGGRSGEFGNLSLPALGGGLTWDTSDLYAGGTIVVAPEPATLVLVAMGAVAMLRRRRQ